MSSESSAAPKTTAEHVHVLLFFFLSSRLRETGKPLHLECRVKEHWKDAGYEQRCAALATLEASFGTEGTATRLRKERRERIPKNYDIYTLKKNHHIQKIQKKKKTTNNAAGFVFPHEPIAPLGVFFLFTIDPFCL